jgi:hypothetical protein
VNRALWLLIGLQLRGWGRYLVRSLGTVKGAVLAVVGLVFFVVWLLPVLLLPHSGGGMAPEVLRRYGPAGLLLYCLGNVLFSSEQKAVYFTPSEVNFLFPGPFGRREILGYKILSTLLVSLPSTLLLALVLRVPGTWFPAAYVGLLLLIVFMQLFSMAITLVATAVGARLYSRGRKLVLAAVVVLAAAVAVRVGGSPAGWRPRELVDRLTELPAWQVASQPLAWFFDAFLATRLWPNLALYACLGVLVNLAVLAVVFALDAHYLETAAASSARIYVRLQRLRGRSVTVGDEASGGRKARLAVPDLPWWGGVGPVFWRQLTTALRGLGRVVFVFFVMGVVMVGPMVASVSSAEAAAAVPAVGVMVVSMTVFLTALVPFDFRGDVDRIAVLKTLPLPGWRLALGQLLAPVVLTCALQWLVLAAVLWVSRRGGRPLLICAAYAVPFDFLLFAMENLFFLLFPTRLAAATPGDFQALGRNVLFLLAKMLVLMLVGFLAAVAGVVAWLLTGGTMVNGELTGGSPMAAWLGGWPVVALSGAAFLPLIAYAFQAFDVGRDTPP